MNSIKDILKTAFTEIDNSTYDVTKISFAISIIAAIGYAGYDLIIIHNAFNMQNYGVGLGGLFGGGAAAMNFKKDSPVQGTANV